LKVAVFDMDGVFTVCRSSWAWVHRHYGVDNEKSVRDYLQGRIDDYEFMRRDIALWRRALGREVTVEDVVRPLKDIKFTQGAVELVEGLKERGYRVGIISGGLDLLAERLLREGVELDFYLANGVEVKDGVLTGEGVLRVPLKEKDQVLLSLLERYYPCTDTLVVVGDTVVDIPMLRMADLAIAFRAESEKVVEVAHIRVEGDDLREILRAVDFYERVTLQSPGRA